MSLPKRILVLGGSGFIGLRLSQRLAGEGAELVLADDFSRGRQDRELNDFIAAAPRARLIHVDLTRASSFETLGSFDEVYLLAAIVGVGNAVHRPADVLRTNTLIVLHTLEWMERSRSKRLFYASTSENYAGGYEHQLVPIPTPETVPLVISDIQNPRFSYAVSKLWGEAAVQYLAARAGFEFVIGRYHNVYGPRMGYEHVIPQLSMRIAAGETPLRVYAPNQTRAFCHVSDAVRATVALMRCPAAMGRTVHIGNDREEIAIGELATMLLRTAGREPLILPQPAPPGSVERRCPDVTLLRQLTGFEPETSLAIGLPATFSWYRQANPNAYE